MSNLSYTEIIDMAIANESEAYVFYRGVANMLLDSNSKSIFENMAEEELRHRDLLQSYLNGTIKEFNFKTPPDYKISEIVDKPKLSLEMKPVDAIALAMKNEEDTMNMYQKFADASADDGQRNLFMELVKMEEGHKVKLEDIYTNMVFPEVW